MDYLGPILALSGSLFPPESSGLRREVPCLAHRCVQWYSQSRRQSRAWKGRCFLLLLGAWTSSYSWGLEGWACLVRLHLIFRCLGWDFSLQMPGSLGGINVFPGELEVFFSRFERLESYQPETDLKLTSFHQWKKKTAQSSFKYNLSSPCPACKQAGTEWDWPCCKGGIFLF